MSWNLLNASNEHVIEPTHATPYVKTYIHEYTKPQFRTRPQTIDPATPAKNTNMYSHNPIISKRFDRL